MGSESWSGEQVMSEKWNYDATTWGTALDRQVVGGKNYGWIAWG